MATLPADFTAEDIHEKTFRYTDAVVLVADMRRVRRRLGWRASASGVDDERKRYCFTLYSDEIGEDDLYGSVFFEILFKAVYQNLWPSLYPDNPEVQELRRLLVDTRYGVHGVANLVNQTVKDEDLAEEPGQSALDQLLDDDS